MIFVILLIFVTLLAVFCSAIYEKTKKNWVKGFFVWGSFTFIAVIIAFRALSVGSDTRNYSRLFEEIAIRDVFDNVDFELGYILLVKFLNVFSSSSRILFVFEGLLVMICYSRFISKYSDNIRQSYLFVLSYLAFNTLSFQLSAVRQAIAMCICLFAYDFIMQKKPVKFVIAVLLASMFHTSALLLLPAYLIAVTKNAIAKIVTLALTLMGLVSIETVMYLVSLVSGKYEEYGIEETGNGYIFLAVITVIVVIVEIFWKKLRDYPTASEMRQVNYISWIIWVWRLVTRVTERAAFFYLPSTMITLKTIPEAFDAERDKRFATMIIAAFLAILFIYRTSGMKYAFA